MSEKKKPIKDIKNLSKKTKQAVKKLASTPAKSLEGSSFVEELLVDNYSEIKKKKESK